MDEDFCMIPRPQPSLKVLPSYFFSDYKPNHHTDELIITKGQISTRDEDDFHNSLCTGAANVHDTVQVAIKRNSKVRQNSSTFSSDSDDKKENIIRFPRNSSPNHASNEVQVNVKIDMFEISNLPSIHVSNEEQVKNAHSRYETLPKSLNQSDNLNKVKINKDMKEISFNKMSPLHILNEIRPNKPKSRYEALRRSLDSALEGAQINDSKKNLIEVEHNSNSYIDDELQLKKTDKPNKPTSRYEALRRSLNSALKGAQINDSKKNLIEMEHNSNSYIDDKLQLKKTDESLENNQDKDNNHDQDKGRICELFKIQRNSLSHAHNDDEANHKYSPRNGDILCKSLHSYESNRIRINNKNKFIRNPDSLFPILRIYQKGDFQIGGNDLIRTIEDMHRKLNEELFFKLNNELNLKILPIQSYIIPSISIGNSSVIISESGGGKSFGCAISILSMIIDSFDSLNSKLPERHDPIAIILCSSWTKVRDMCEVLIKFAPNTLSIVPVWGGNGDEGWNRVKIQILNISHIMVSTIPAIVRLLEDNERESTFSLKLSRCCLMMFDDIQYSALHYPNEILTLQYFWRCHTSESDSRNDLNRQLLIVGNTWSKEVENIVLKLEFEYDPSYIISSHFEAAVMLKIRTTISYVQPMETNYDVALNIIRPYNISGPPKMIVFFKTDEEIIHFEKLLKSIAITPICIQSKRLRFEIQRYTEEWNSHGSIMLMSDGAMNQMIQQNITDAEVIINVGLSDNFISLGDRYSFMMDFYGEGSGEKCISHIIMPTNEKYLPFLTQQLKRLYIPNSDLNGLSKFRATTDQIKLCPSLKGFGICGIVSCPRRHEIFASDVSKYLPHNGELQFRIVNVYSPSYFLVRLTEYRQESMSNFINITKFYQTMFMKLQEWYSHSQNRKIVESPTVGESVAVQLNSEWARAVITMVDNPNNFVSLKLIDEGIKIVKDFEFIYRLPCRYNLMPPLAVPVYLSNIKPVDDDPCWSQSAKYFIEKMVSQCKPENSFKGSILLSLDGNLWLGAVCEIVKVGKKVVQKPTFKSELTTQQFGVNNNEHINRLNEIINKKNLNKIISSNDSDWITFYQDAYDSIISNDV